MVNYYLFYLKNYLEVYRLIYVSYGKKKLRSVLIQNPQNHFYDTYIYSNLIAPLNMRQMDVKKFESQVE